MPWGPLVRLSYVCLAEPRSHKIIPAERVLGQSLPEGAGFEALICRHFSWEPPKEGGEAQGVFGTCTPIPAQELRRSTAKANMRLTDGPRQGFLTAPSPRVLFPQDLCPGHPHDQELPLGQTPTGPPGLSPPQPGRLPSAFHAVRGLGYRRLAAPLPSRLWVSTQQIIRAEARISP